MAQDGVVYVSGLVTEYDAVWDDNRDLRQTLGLMIERTADRRELVEENVRLRALLDFQRARPDLRVEAAEVIQRSGGLLTIDRGSVHGIRESMSVISPDGVIGMITRVDPFSSIVSSLQDPDCRIDAMIERTRVRGTIHGSVSDLSRVCNMHYIEIKDEVHENDRIVTSPESVFPSGLPIGRVSALDFTTGSLWKSVGVEPAADPYRVDELFIVLRSDTPWRELAGVPDDEIGVPVGDSAGSQSIQERLAP